MQNSRHELQKKILRSIENIGKPIYFTIVITIGICLTIIHILKHVFTQIKQPTRPQLKSLHVSKIFRLNNYFRLPKVYLPKLQKKVPSIPPRLLHTILKKIWHSYSFLVKQFKHFHKPVVHITAAVKNIIRNINRIRIPRLHVAHFSQPPSFPSLKTRPLLLPKFPPLRLKVSFIKISILLTIIVSGISFYQIILTDLPHPKDLLDHRPAVTTNIYDRHGTLLYRIYKNENRSIVSLDQIPPHLIQATLAIEDAEFYQHPGFSIKGIVRALNKNVTKNTLQGGSTITQQLVKNTLLSSEKTVVRKIKEIIVAVAVESYFTKEEILTMYLNEVAYGGTAYGIEAASQMYFGKPAAELDLSESALLAGLPAAPTTYSPFGAKSQLATTRQHQVLDRMVQEGFISQTKAQQAKQALLTFVSPTNNIKAPHFVMYIKDELVNQYGEALVNQGGLEVTTSLDYDIQELAQAVIDQEMQQLNKLRVSNAAVIVTQPSTGEVLAMVGSHNYFDTTNDGQVNVVTRPRQPGSSIKPVNYAYALENGFTPSTIIHDTPVVYDIPGSKPYSPVNYDGRFHGYVTLRQALANSYNIPAVKTLNHFGVSSMLNLGQQMGITTWNDPSRFGLALTLGGGEVTLADMATVYGTFANGGTKVLLHPLIKVSDYTGNRQEILKCTTRTQLSFTHQAHAISPECIDQQVLSPGTAFLISDILSDNRARSRAFGTNSILNVDGHQVAVKTGTTNSLRDNWTIGYTKDYLVGVWVGNNDNSPMSHVASGITGASPIWHHIMTALLKDTPSHRFVPPPSVIETTICPLTGTRSCSACPHPKKEYFIQGTEPKHACSNQLIEDILKKDSEKPENDRQLAPLTTR